MTEGLTSLVLTLMEEETARRMVEETARRVVEEETARREVEEERGDGVMGMSYINY